jgi:hypothetical protein
MMGKNILIKKNKSAGKWLGNIIYELDQLGNAVIGPIVSPVGGEKDETWSSAMGKALALQLYLHPDKEPYIPLPYVMGAIFNWICEIFQKCHSLQSIEWDEGYKFTNQTEMKKIVESYLKKKGVAI